jgi:hypothetical protein
MSNADQSYVQQTAANLSFAWAGTEHCSASQLRKAVREATASDARQPTGNEIDQIVTLLMPTYGNGRSGDI